MTTALDCAYYFVQRGMDDPRDTFDGNMKLQKLLFFAQMIGLAETGKPLFDDPVYAFDRGCVVEAVRPVYKHENKTFVENAKALDLSKFNETELDILGLTADIYGSSRARTLSDVTHEMPCWINAHERYRKTGLKSSSIITPEEMTADTAHIKDLIDIARDLKENPSEREVINGISFYYDPEEVTMDDALREELFEYAKVYPDGEAFTITYVAGEMVIY